MKKLKFDRNFAYRFAIYARMSSDAQNPRSPDQQMGTIREEIVRQSLPWVEIKTYRDAGITGRVKSKRPGFMELLDDIKCGRLNVHIVLVDTFERLGRSDDIASVVQFMRRHGVLLLDAKSHFADPTTSEGRLLSAIEAWRGCQESEVKGHMVRRGKRDAIQRGFWPGGPVPIGYMLEAAETERRAGRDIVYNKLMPDPSTRFVVERMFQLADENGFGAPRIAKFLNRDPAIPNRLKPFQPNTVSDILSNQIYLGHMIWEQNTADYQDDVRVITPNPSDEWQTVEDYCPPIIDQERWDRVQVLKRQRSAAHRASRQSPAQKSSNGFRGVALKYPLSGLVVCSKCGRSMTVSKRDKTDKHPGSAPAYRCPRVASGACTNRSYVNIAWLLDTVVALLVKRLFLNPDGPTTIDPEIIQSSELFLEFLDLVESEVSRQQIVEPSQLESLTAEHKDLTEQQQGWATSLGNPKLPESLRTALEGKYVDASDRLEQINHELARCGTARRALTANCSAERVAELLSQLSTVLAKDNPSASNLELARHVDRITVTEDGMVQIRMSKLGFMISAGSVAPVLQANPAETEKHLTKQKRPRRLIESDDSKPWEVLLRGDYSIDVHRFDHLSDEWFWVDQFQIPYKRCWSEVHALAVAQSRLESPCALETLAKRFGVSKPTIEVALNHARSLGVDATRIDGRRLQQNWAVDNAAIVAEFFRNPEATMSAAVKHFGKSDCWIRKARNLGQRKTYETDTPG